MRTSQHITVRALLMHYLEVRFSHNPLLSDGEFDEGHPYSMD